MTKSALRISGAKRSMSSRWCDRVCFPDKGAMGISRFNAYHSTSYSRKERHAPRLQLTNESTKSGRVSVSPGRSNGQPDNDNCIGCHFIHDLLHFAFNNAFDLLSPMRIGVLAQDTLCRSLSHFARSSGLSGLPGGSRLPLRPGRPRLPFQVPGTIRFLPSSR